ncbi:ankyrin repeat-containing domain protein [Russula brevipes]|nr:ankyrin repeat-containing domain protein [Russula brevipes]
MDSTAIAMEERVWIEDSMASTVLNAASGSGYGPREAPGDAELNIFAAAQQGKTEQIRALIESGRARTTDRDADAATPLHWAAICGHADACRYLLTHRQGADVNAAGGADRATPLQLATRNGLAAIVDLLTRHGADPRLVDAKGYCCLHTVSNCLILIYLLCRPGVHVDQRDAKGLTPLHWAVNRSDEESTQVLLALGADPNAADQDGLTALHWAVNGGNRRCIALLLEAGADIRGSWRLIWTTFRRGTRWLGSWDSGPMRRGCVDRSASPMSMSSSFRFPSYLFGSPLQSRACFHGTIS